jgi:hypothetical protein
MSCRVMLADRWDKVLAGVEMVECAQTRRFQQDACYQPKDPLNNKHWQRDHHVDATKLRVSEAPQLVTLVAVSKEGWVKLKSTALASGASDKAELVV